MENREISIPDDFKYKIVIVQDDKVFAVGVDGYPTNNKKAHITLAVNRQGGGKPMMSNNLENWRPIGFPLVLKGIVTQVKR